MEEPTNVPSNPMNHQIPIFKYSFIPFSLFKFQINILLVVQI